MNFKKLLAFVVAGLMIGTFSTGAFAETFSVSAGIPMQHSFDGKWDNGDKLESEGVSGYMLYVKFPIMVGIGLEAYETLIKAPTGANFDDMKLTTSLFDVFYLTPIPLVNVTIGVGAGTTGVSCSVSGGETCDDYYEAGISYQWWAQLGFSFFPFLDAHLSYHDVTAKVKGKSGSSDLSFNGNVIALGVAFIF